MKQTDILPAVLKGDVLAVGELLSWDKAKEFPAKDNKGNVIPDKFNVRSSGKVLIGTETYEVGSFIKVARADNGPERPKWATDRCKVVIRAKSIEQTKWGNRIDGEILPFEQ